MYCINSSRNCPFLFLEESTDVFSANFSYLAQQSLINPLGVV